LYRDNVYITQAPYIDVFSIANANAVGCIGKPSLQPYYNYFKIRNIKIFTDTAGTVPFLSLPMQSAQDLMVDRVSGLVGTATNVQIINNNTNILKSKNSWGYFNGSSTYISIGTKAQFNFMHKTAIFKFEVDFIPLSLTGVYCPFFCNKISSGGNAAGVEIGQWTHYIKITIANGTAANGHIYLPSFFTSLNTLYKIKVIADGITLSLYKNDVLFTSVAISGVLGTTDSQYLPYIGRSQGQTYYLNGYLRNMKFYDNPNSNFPIYWYTLQDPLNIGKDVVGGLQGTVSNVNVIDINERGDWALFNNSAALCGAAIGTTSTLGWMNSGNWNMEFEIKPYTFGSTFRPIDTGGNPASKGFMLYGNGSNYNFYWSNGSGGSYACIVSNIITGPVNGTTYKVVIRADVNTIYIVVYNADGSLNKTSTPSPCNFIPNATTTHALTFNYIATAGGFQLRNFKIFSDTAGTIPFLSLPMQSAQDLMTDKVTGLQGVAYNVQIVNNNTNVLRNKDLWCDFSQGLSSVANAFSPIGLVSSFNWIHETCKFEISYDIYFRSHATVQQLFYNAVGSTQKGIYMFISGGDNRISFRMFNAVPGTPILSTSGTLTENALNKIRIVGDGVNCIIYVNGVANSPYLIGTKPTGNATYAGVFGQGTTSIKTNSYIRHLKMYNDNNLIYYWPLIDGGNITKEVITNLSTTYFAGSTIKVIEI